MYLKKEKSSNQNVHHFLFISDFFVCVCLCWNVCLGVERFGPFRIRMNSPLEFTLGNTNGLALPIWAIAAYGYPPPEPIWMPVNGNARYFLRNNFYFFCTISKLNAQILSLVVVEWFSSITSTNISNIYFFFHESL